MSGGGIQTDYSLRETERALIVQKPTKEGDFEEAIGMALRSSMVDSDALRSSMVKKKSMNFASSSRKSTKIANEMSSFR
jgi:hypothetical protein